MNAINLDLQKIEDFLDANAPAFLATIGTCGNPRVRPMQSALLYENKIYFCTSTTKNLYRHIQAHKGIEICACARDATFLRLRAEAVFSDSMAVKIAMFSKYAEVESIYKTPQNPIFTVFYLDKLSARLQLVDGSFTLYKEEK